MKSLTAGLEAHYASSQKTLATCWKIVRQDGLTFAYTDHMESLLFQGVTYLPISSFSRTTIDSTNSTSGDSLSINGVMIAANLTREDLVAGRYENAALEVFEVNYKDLTQGKNILRTGNLAEVRIEEQEFVAEFRGLVDRLRNVVGRLAFKLCDADLGDARCGVDLNAFTNGRVSTTITSITTQRQFTCSSLTQAAGWFENGQVTFTSGLNNGLKMNVKTHSTGGVLVLKNTLPYAIAIGDALTAEVGCLKRYNEDCITKFANGNRFRGFPVMPLGDQFRQ